MAQRDTMIPVCKIIVMGPNQRYDDIPLTNTAVSFSEIRYAPEPSCMPNQVMTVIVSSGDGAAAMDAEWVSGTANVHIMDGKITQIETINPGRFDWSVASKGGLQVVTPQAQLSSISVGPRTIQYKNSIGTVFTSSSPTWQKLTGNIASGVDGATTLFGVSAGQDSSALVEVTYHQHGGIYTTRILSPGIWAKGINPQRPGYNYRVGDGTSTDATIDSLSGVITQVGDRNGGMFDLSSSWYEEVSSVNGDASAGFFMVSSYRVRLFNYSIINGKAS